MDFKNFKTTITYDPSFIYDKKEKTYWMFHTAPGIRSASSADGADWTVHEPLFAEPLPWWKEYVPAKKDFNIWAPEICFHSGDYWLYYSVSTFGSKTSCLGLLKSQRPAGPWEDQGMVIASNENTSYNCIDPGVVHTEKGVFLSFGSWFSGIYLTELDEATMKPLGQDLIKIGDRQREDNSIEAAFIWNPGNGYFYLFAAFDLCCRGLDSTYNIRYGRSTSVKGEFKDKEGRSMLEGGGTMMLKTEEDQIGPGGPFVFETAQGEWALGYHYYDNREEGKPKLGIKKVLLKDDWVELR